MERKYFTIAGTSHHFGSDFMEPKMKVSTPLIKCKKTPF